MKGIILLNGEPYNNIIKKNKGDFVVCCDGAYNWAKDKVDIDIFMGDFDSLSFIPENSLVYPSEKNYTDGELALRYLLKNYNEIEIYGGGGKREDHFFGNINLLYLAFKNKAKCVMLTNYSKIFIASGKVFGSGKKGNIISIVPFFENVHIISSEGLKYPLNDLTLEKGSTRGISNELNKNEYSFEINKGTPLIIVNREI